MTLRRPNYVYPPRPEDGKSRALVWENTETGIETARPEDFPLEIEGKVDNGGWGDSEIYLGGYDLDEVFKLLQGRQVRIRIEWL